MYNTNFMLLTIDFNDLSKTFIPAIPPGTMPLKKFDKLGTYLPVVNSFYWFLIKVGTEQSRENKHWILFYCQRLLFVPVISTVNDLCIFKVRRCWSLRCTCNPVRSTTPIRTVSTPTTSCPTRVTTDTRTRSYRSARDSGIVLALNTPWSKWKRSYRLWCERISFLRRTGVPRRNTWD